MSPEQQRLIQRMRVIIGEMQAIVGELSSCESAAAYLDLRAGLGILDAELNEVNNHLARHWGLGSARNRLLAYLRNHVGEVLGKEQLAGVAGIYEFQRRIRELRTDDGWTISSMETRDDLRPGEYLLRNAERDPQQIADWVTTRGIRKLAASPTDRVVALLCAVAPRWIDKEQFQHVIGGADIDAVLRDAIDQGWPIESPQENGQAAPGHYCLVARFDG